MPFRAVLLDIDGTLVDSNDAHARSWVDGLGEASHHCPFEEVRPLIGMGSDKLLERLLGLKKESPEGEALARRIGEIFLERYLPGVKPFPGVRDLLLRLRKDGLQLVAATSAERDKLHRLLEIAGVADLISDTASSQDVANSKPDPDIIHAALEQCTCPPEQVVMIGDTPYDLEACARAGIPCIAFRCGGWSDADLSGALAIYDGPADLLERYDASVFKAE